MIILSHSIIEGFVCNAINIQYKYLITINIIASMAVVSSIDLISSIQVIVFGVASALFVMLLLIRKRRKSKERLKRLTLEKLKCMDAKGFEHVVADILRAMGYKDVKVVGGSGDLAVDITARHGRDKVVVQCKRYTSKKVTSPEMQMFIGMMLTEYNARKGIYVTTSSFTQDAIELARRHGIELWDGNTLAEMVSRLG